MTPTIDSEKYKTLLKKYLPVPILTEADNERSLAIVEQLMKINPRSSEEESVLNLLLQLIERFEAKHYSFEEDLGETSSPQSILGYLMEEHRLKQADLVDLIGSTGVVSEIVNGRRSINKAQAIALSELFHVDPSLFNAGLSVSNLIKSDDEARALAQNQKKYKEIEQIINQSIIVGFLKKSNIGTLSLISSMFGGLIFIIYFASIGYMPDLDIQSSIYQIYTIALSGAFLLFGISILIVLPGIYYQNWVNKSPFKDKLKGHSEGFVRLSTAQIFIYIGIAFILTPLLGGISKIFILLGILIFYVGVCLFHGVIKNNKTKIIFSFKELCDPLLFKTIAYSFINPLLIVVIIFSYAIVGTDFIVSISKDAYLAMVFLCLVPIIVIFINKFAIYSSSQNGQVRYESFLLCGLVAVLLIQLIFSNVPFLPSRIVSMYGWGNVTDTTLVLNQDGCEIARILELPVKSNTVTSQDKICKIEKVDILSRLGTKYYLKAKSINNSTRKFEIPSSMIYSWSN